MRTVSYGNLALIFTILSPPKLDSSSTEFPPCNEDQLMIYLAEIQAINPESIVNLASMESITVICDKVLYSLERTNNYLKSCDPPEQTDLYVQLIKGVDALYNKLCGETTFREKFSQHFACYLTLHNDYEDCSGPSDWTESFDNDTICAAYKDISDCYYVKTAKLCGIQAAYLMKELTDDVIKSVLVIKCSNINPAPAVKDAMPVDLLQSKSGVTTIWYSTAFITWAVIMKIIQLY